MFFITAMANILTENDRFDSEKTKHNSERCFGYYKNKEDAISAVKRNACDM